MYDENVIDGLKRLDREVNDLAISNAIKEIERLRDAMKQILDCEDCPEKIAREALEGGDDE